MYQLVLVISSLVGNEHTKRPRHKGYLSKNCPGTKNGTEVQENLV